MTKPLARDIEICQASVRFSQEGNTMGTTTAKGTHEYIDVEMEFQLDEQDGPFYVIRTEGWSVDEAEDFAALINQAKKVLNRE